MQIKITQTLGNAEIADAVACYIIEKEQTFSAFMDYSSTLSIYLSTIRDIQGFAGICRIVQRFSPKVLEECRYDHGYKTLTGHITDWLNAETGQKAFNEA